MPIKNIKKPKNNKYVIVLVEDDEFLSNMYKTKLEMENYEVFVAGDGESGVKIISAKMPDLILLDIVLPKTNGFDVLKRIKSDKNLKQIPVILLTNLGQKEDVKKGFELGANEYLIKAHFLPSEVVSKINSLIIDSKIKK